MQRLLSVKISLKMFFLILFSVLFMLFLFKMISFFFFQSFTSIIEFKCIKSVLKHFLTSLVLSSGLTNLLSVLNCLGCCCFHPYQAKTQESVSVLYIWDGKQCNRFNYKSWLNTSPSQLCVHLNIQVPYTHDIFTSLSGKTGHAWCHNLHISWS